VATLAVVIGIDIGQKVDPTAIAVVERQDRRGEDHHVVRYLERLALGTPYPKIAERLAEVVTGVRAKGGITVTVYVDATGVGGPVVDLLAVAGVKPIACYFTYGDRWTKEGRQVSIGKAWLVSRMQALLQTERLHLPDTDEARVLAKELQDYEIRVDQDANDKYGAFKVGTHDDLATALGLAVQPPGPSRRLVSW